MGGFSLYDLVIESCIGLPELERSQSESDVTITFGNVVAPHLESERPDSSVGTQTVVLSYPDIGQFEIRQGKTITVDPVADVSDQRIRAVLMGPAMGFLLHQRGFLVLHGSAVGRDGTVFVFLGAKGAGKSTTAGALAREGYTILCDDVTAIDVDDDPPRVFPGRPHVKLADNHFDYEPFPTTESLEMVKQYYRVPDVPGRRPGRLGTIFLLKRGSELAVDTPSPSEGVWGLLEHLYLRQFSDDLAIDRCFEQVTTLAEQVPIRRLTRPDDIRALSTVPRIINNVRK